MTLNENYKNLNLISFDTRINQDIEHVGLKFSCRLLKLERGQDLKGSQKLFNKMKKYVRNKNSGGRLFEILNFIV